MKKRQKQLTDEQWKLIEALLPKPKRRRDKRGRPSAPNRACLEGTLWGLQTGAARRFLPDEPFVSLVCGSGHGRVGSGTTQCSRGTGSGC